MFLETWNNGGSYQRQRKIEADAGRLQEQPGPVSIPTCPGGCPGQSATKERIPGILTLSFNNEGS